MAEQEWLKYGHINALLSGSSLQVSRRKARLFACACCRTVWEHVGPALREALAVSEEYAEQQASADDLAAARSTAQQIRISRRNTPRMAIHSFLGALADDARILETAARAADDAAFFWALHATKYPKNPAHDPDWGDAYGFAGNRHNVFARCIFGNPFRPATTHPEWQTATAVSLARAAYEERIVPAGTLDPVRLAVLADALEDAGCSCGEALAHLRSPGPHVRGCWAVDLILGKEQEAMPTGAPS